jgi:hypothetical protein
VSVAQIESDRLLRSSSAGESEENSETEQNAAQTRHDRIQYTAPELGPPAVRLSRLA